MIELPDPGLYRTTEPMPKHEEEFPAGVLVYIGQSANGGGKFVVRPQVNVNNRWRWGEPTTPLRYPDWAKKLKPLPSEGYYNLPQTLDFEDGARWLENALVQLGYNGEGKPIIFVAEDREAETANALHFSDSGRLIDDRLLARLKWAPILPVPKAEVAS